jgi:hypothetical protein
MRYDGTAPELIRGLLVRVAAGQAAPAALAWWQREFVKKLRDSGDPEPWLHPYFWAVYTPRLATTAPGRGNENEKAATIAGA